jgi:hypothetical protein
MAKRLSRKRLFAIGAKGEEMTSTAGVAVTASIGAQTRFREGAMITTEFQIDLASSKGAMHSFATVGSGAGAVKAIGLSSSSGTHGSAVLCLLNGTGSAADGIGVLSAAELICVEAVKGGTDNIGVYYGQAAPSSSGDVMDTNGTEFIAPAVMGLGRDTVASDIDIDVDNSRLYLVSSGSVAANYTAGKLVLRLIGYNTFDDV